MLHRNFATATDSLPVLGLGCSKVGSFNNPVPMADIRRLLAQALDLGVTLLDTADVYGQGDSEREIGRALASRRADAFVVTKVGKRFSTRMRLLAPFKPILKPLIARSGDARQAVTARRDGNMATDFSPAHIVAGTEASLRRLKMDRIDGLLLHSPPASVLRDPAVGAALATLKTAGKVRHFGVSCDDVEALEASMAIPGIELLQLPLDVIEAAGEATIDAIEARSIGVIAREVIRFQPGIAPPQAVVRALGMRGVSTVVLGTSRLAHLQEAVRAVSALKA
jgi:aryl-alcohol dehydrogenase-like predicted oxidoreductase